MSGIDVLIVIFSNLLTFGFLDVSLSIFAAGRRVNKWSNLVLYIVAVGLNSILIFFVPIDYVFIMLSFIVMVGYSIIFKMSVTLHVLAILISWIIIVTTEVAFGLIYSLIYNLTIEQTQTNVIVTLQIAVFSKLLILIIAAIIKSKFKTYSKLINYKIVLGLSVMPIVTAGILYLITKLTVDTDSEQIKWLSICMSLLLISCNVIILFIFNYSNKLSEKLRDSQLKMQVEVLEKGYYQNLAVRQELSSKELHDLKNVAFALDSLIQTNDMKAKEKISELCGIIQDSETKSYMGISSIDYLIESKRREAECLGIDFTVTSCIDSESKTDPIELCVIFGNLLDNAIEGSVMAEGKKYINLQLNSIEHYIKMQLINSCEDTIKIEKSKKTSKDNDCIHGFGIKNVKEIISEQNGLYSAGKQNGEYVVEVLIS